MKKIDAIKAAIYNDVTTFLNGNGTFDYRYFEDHIRKLNSNLFDKNPLDNFVDVFVVSDQLEAYVILDLENEGKYVMHFDNITDPDHRLGVDWIEPMNKDYYERISNLAKKRLEEYIQLSNLLKNEAIVKAFQLINIFET